jgi:hypothetical protein
MRGADTFFCGECQIRPAPIKPTSKVRSGVKSSRSVKVKPAKIKKNLKGKNNNTDTSIARL